MASIRKRIPKGCVNWSYQVQLRRKGIPSFTISFCTLDEAENWVKENEQRYLENPTEYDHLRQSYRELRREREFKMKKLKEYIPRKKPKNIQDELQNFRKRNKK